MPKSLLLIGDESLEPMTAALGWRSQRARSVDTALELVRAAPLAFDVVLADLRLIAEPANTVVEQLNGCAGRALPIVAILDPARVESALSAKRLGIAWVDERWLGIDHGAPVRICLEQMVLAFERASALAAYEERREQLVHAEKFAAVGLLAAEIAHEINNPSTFVITNLTVMMDYVDTIGRFHDSLRAEVAEMGLVDAPRLDELSEDYEIQFLREDLQSLLDRSLAGLNRIHQIVQDLRYFSHERPAESGWFDLGGLLRASVNLVRHEARYRARIVMDIPDSLPPIRTNPNRLSQVVLNLLVNAVQAIPAGRPSANEIRITAETRDEQVIIRVADTGSGIPSELLSRVFEPFFTTKPPGDGTGLGLSISRDVIRKLGGELDIETVIGRGATFSVTLPIKRDDDD